MIAWLLLSLVALAADVPQPATTSSSGQLRVMSFNLRYSTAADGANRWANRRDILAQAIRQYDPDLLGTQECVADQADFLRNQLKHMTLIAVHRDDGKRKGEAAAILFRAARFELLDSGTFWLSPTPEKVGSKGWDANSVRIVTWARLRDKVAGREVVWLNTHWDHVGKQARLESAGMMRRWIDERAGHLPVIVTGDFNAHLDSPEYARMFDTKGFKRELSDAHSQLHGAGNDGGGTYHGFSGKGAGARIDWIICSTEFEPVEAGIDKFNVDGRYPSDHFAVTAVLRYKSP